MQNNITELAQKLLRALDSNYNVIDMATVIEVISLLEKVSITKELLETTRLGKHINELRRNTSNESLAKRAKELVKKWRNKLLSVPVATTQPAPAIADTNGQIKPHIAEIQATPQQTQNEEPVQVQAKKRPAKDKLEVVQPKRVKINGTASCEYDFSDNSNSSFKEAPSVVAPKNVILINSDSNSSIPDVKHEPLLEEQQPKKRGRKKGSKNHRNLLEEAETAFTTKMAVSRGNAKVKTTQELIASLQNKNNSTTSTSPVKNIEDWKERAAKLTERVSFIDQKLNTNTNRYNKRNLTKRGKGAAAPRSDRVIESGSFSNVKTEDAEVLQSSEREEEDEEEDEINVVDDELQQMHLKTEEQLQQDEIDASYVPSLSIEEAMSRLPPIDVDCLRDNDEHACRCVLRETPKPDLEADDDDDDDNNVIKPEDAAADQDKYTFLEDCFCPARSYLADKYRLTDVDEDRIAEIHTHYVENVNGNFGHSAAVSSCKREEGEDDKSDDINKIVPNFYELLPKSVHRDSVCENFKKYSISNGSDGTIGGGADETDAKTTDEAEDAAARSNNNSEAEFQEFHKVLDRPSYNGEILKILPYVIID